MPCWGQICLFSFQGASYDEVKQLIANAREHAAEGATIYMTGQPLYESGWTCDLAGADGPQLTDDLAQQAAADSTQNVIYPPARSVLLDRKRRPTTATPTRRASNCSVSRQSAISEIGQSRSASRMAFANRLGSRRFSERVSARGEARRSSA